MTRIEICIECQHLERANTEYPCVNCRNNAKNNFVPVEKNKTTRFDGCNPKGNQPGNANTNTLDGWKAIKNH